MSDAQVNFPPGKNLPARVADTALVRSYAARIGDGWRHAAQGMMEVARLCSEANDRLTVSAKRELIRQLPFKGSAFSKFVQIGKDAWVHALHAQRLLPPHYTIVYLLTRLTDEELRSAINEGVIKPDMKRADLQRWQKARRGWTQNASPADHAPPILDRRGAEVVAAQNEEAFAALAAAWTAAADLQAAWTNASDAARERFVGEVLCFERALSRWHPNAGAVAAVLRKWTRTMTGSSNR